MSDPTAESEKHQIKWEEPFRVLNLIRHVDPRGFLIELLRFRDWNIPGGGQLYVFSIEPQKRRGDHYHLHKREWFTCAFGEAVILLSSREGKNYAGRLSPQEPKIVYAAPGTSHALINDTEQPALIVSYGSEQHDSKDEDTYRSVAHPSYR
ncbi:WxcM-like domain-containing protein [bacterium]|nr:WxcM-like domain-containing protein [bacterium]